MPRLLRFTMGGVGGSVDILGDGSRGDLATLHVVKVENLWVRAARLRFRLYARLAGGGRVELQRQIETSEPDVTVPAFSTRACGVGYYLPVAEYDAMPFEVVAEKGRRRITLPYVGSMP